MFRSIAAAGMRVAAASALLIALGGSAVPQALDGSALLAALRQGGHVLLFRHAATDWQQADRVAAEGDWTSCDPARMRQLSAAGRTDARRIGVALRTLRIPVGHVRASEYCRTVETARLLGVGEVEPTREILNPRAADFVGGADALTTRGRKAIAEAPAPGTNTVLVSHGLLIRAATGAYPGEGGAAIFAVRDGTFHLVAEVDAQRWAELARAYGGG